MHLTINGQSQHFNTLHTAATLMLELGVDSRKAAFEQNRTIIPKSLHATTPLQNDDIIEIVAFIGGG